MTFTNSTTAENIMTKEIKRKKGSGRTVHSVIRPLRRV